MCVDAGGRQERASSPPRRPMRPATSKILGDGPVRVRRDANGRRLAAGLRVDEAFAYLKLTEAVGMSVHLHAVDGLILLA